MGTMNAKYALSIDAGVSRELVNKEAATLLVEVPLPAALLHIPTDSFNNMAMHPVCATREAPG